MRSNKMAALNDRSKLFFFRFFKCNSQNIGAYYIVKHRKKKKEHEGPLWCLCYFEIVPNV